MLLYYMPYCIYTKCCGQYKRASFQYSSYWIQRFISEQSPDSMFPRFCRPSWDEYCRHWRRIKRASQSEALGTLIQWVLVSKGHFPLNMSWKDTHTLTRSLKRANRDHAVVQVHGNEVKAICSENGALVSKVINKGKRAREERNVPPVATQLCQSQHETFLYSNKYWL